MERQTGKPNWLAIIGVVAGAVADLIARRLTPVSLSQMALVPFVIEGGLFLATISSVWGHVRGKPMIEHPIVDFIVATPKGVALVTILLQSYITLTRF